MLLATGALVVAAVAACGGSQTASGSSAGSAPAEAPANSQSQSGAGGAGQPATAKAPQNGGACRSADLKAALGAKQEVPTDVQGQLGAAGTHYKVNLVWTNHSGHSCTMQGFGGVDVVGPGQGSNHPTFSLPRMGETPAVVKLAAGGTAHTTINYIDPSGVQPDSQAAQLWTPTHLSVTPPNETTHLSVPWTLGTPFYQDSEAGIAAAGISPVIAGS
ncbi:DUF4232 domain-containing protein [Amycolatopsis saalfeldensis]|uniref:DUF4232 domain-containing protein n=1 Tax=Amycolatopsis saalfeldensis TaxID=394193 RepID=A0A1H8YA97_9PSEU|nr:DUF4232 domain-containing protein [Amycolatopsis saalfeldensis]SEP49017.1 Protein of unknown function [Amycolatopsis saalfeldensis]